MHRPWLTPMASTTMTGLHCSPYTGLHEKVPAPSPATRSLLKASERTEFKLAVPQYNLSVESNQNVESKRQSVESKMGK